MSKAEREREREREMERGWNRERELQLTTMKESMREIVKTWYVCYEELFHYQGSKSTSKINNGVYFSRPLAYSLKKYNNWV